MRGRKCGLSALLRYSDDCGTGHRTRDDQPEPRIHRAVFYNTKLLSCDRGRTALRNEATDATDLRTYRTQLLLDALVAAIDVVHTVDDGFAISYQCCQHE